MASEQQPLGPVAPGVVEAAFANFDPAMVRRAIPDAWKFAAPADLVKLRAAAAAQAIRRVCGDLDELAATMNGDLEAVISAATSIGRPLFGANRDVGPFDDPVARLWQNCTALREHRGDGHVAALVVTGVDGCEAHLLQAAGEGVDPAVYFDSRGWSMEHQDQARGRLTARGLLRGARLTSEGSALRSQVEATTDARASEPFERALDPDQRRRLLRTLAAVSAQILRSGTIPFPNPMGLRG